MIGESLLEFPKYVRAAVGELDVLVFASAGNVVFVVQVALARPQQLKPSGGNVRRKVSSRCAQASLIVYWRRDEDVCRQCSPPRFSSVLGPLSGARQVGLAAEPSPGDLGFNSSPGAFDSSFRGFRAYPSSRGEFVASDKAGPRRSAGWPVRGLRHRTARALWQVVSDLVVLPRLAAARTL
jgi:hypothetical protein